MSAVTFKCSGRLIQLGNLPPEDGGEQTAGTAGRIDHKESPLRRQWEVKQAHDAEGKARSNGPDGANPEKRYQTAPGYAARVEREAKTMTEDVVHRSDSLSVHAGLVGGLTGLDNRLGVGMRKHARRGSKRRNRISAGMTGITVGIKDGETDGFAQRGVIICLNRLTCGGQYGVDSGLSLGVHEIGYQD